MNNIIEIEEMKIIKKFIAGEPVLNCDHDLFLVTFNSEFKGMGALLHDCSHQSISSVGFGFDDEVDKILLFDLSVGGTIIGALYDSIPDDELMELITTYNEKCGQDGGKISALYKRNGVAIVVDGEGFQIIPSIAAVIEEYEKMM